MTYTNVHFTGTEINQYHLQFYCLVAFEGQRELLYVQNMNVIISYLVAENRGKHYRI